MSDRAFSSWIVTALPFSDSLRAASAAVDALGDRLHFALNLADKALDVAGTLFGRLRQRPYFIGNDREALAVLTCPGRLDGGVKGQQVGLVRNARDRLDDFADVGGLLLEFNDHLNGGELAVGAGADIGDRCADLGVQLAQQGLQRLGFLPRDLRLFLRLGHTGGDIGDSDERLLGCAGCFFGSGRDLLHRLGKFLRCGRGFTDRRSHLCRRRGHALGDLLLTRKGASSLALNFSLASTTVGTV
jgi:hypothetical protein